VAQVEPAALLGDKGYDSDGFIEVLEMRAIKPVIPPKANRRVKRHCDFALYCERNLVERFFNAIKHFRGIATRELALSVLAGMPPKAEWEGCLVYQGVSPIDGPTVCLATRGSGADEVQLHLLEAFETYDIRILEVYEGGPDVGQAIAVAREGRWSAP